MPGSEAPVRAIIRPDHLSNALWVLDELGGAAAALRALRAPQHHQAARFVVGATARLLGEAGSRLEALALRLDAGEAE